MASMPAASSAVANVAMLDGVDQGLPSSSTPNGYSTMNSTCSPHPIRSWLLNALHSRRLDIPS